MPTTGMGVINRSVNRSPVRKGPVGYRVCDQSTVWNDYFRLIKGLDNRGSRSERFDLRPLVGDGEVAANFYGLLKQKNQSGDKVVDDALQTKTDTYT